MTVEEEREQFNHCPECKGKLLSLPNSDPSILIAHCRNPQCRNVEEVYQRPVVHACSLYHIFEGIVALFLGMSLVTILIMSSQKSGIMLSLQVMGCLYVGFLISFCCMMGLVSLLSRLNLSPVARYDIQVYLLSHFHTQNPENQNTILENSHKPENVLEN